MVYLFEGKYVKLSAEGLRDGHIYYRDEMYEGYPNETRFLIGEDIDAVHFEIDKRERRAARYLSELKLAWHALHEYRESLREADRQQGEVGNERSDISGESG